MSDEDRLREAAAKRLERRRRKMESAEERLAKITGQPVATAQPIESAADQPIDAAAGQPDEDVDGRDGATSANGDIVGHLDPSPSVVPEPVPRFLQPVPDPPLEHLERVPSLNSDFSPSLDMDMLSGLLSGGSTTNSSGPVYQVWAMRKQSQEYEKSWLQSSASRLRFITVCGCFCLCTILTGEGWM